MKVSQPRHRPALDHPIPHAKKPLFLPCPKWCRKTYRHYHKRGRSKSPRPADVTIPVLCQGECRLWKPLSTFLDKANRRFKLCLPCRTAARSRQRREFIARVKADPRLLAEMIAKIPPPPPSGPGIRHNVQDWHNWRMTRNSMLACYGLKEKVPWSPEAYFNRRAEIGKMTYEEAAGRIADYYAKHPHERPTEGPDSLNGGN